MHMPSKTWSKEKSVGIVLAIGIMLAIVKIIYSFFDFYNVLDLLVFCGAGYAIGLKVWNNRWIWGLWLSFPAQLLCLLFTINLGYTAIINGTGTAYAVSLILMPAAACIGIAIHARRMPGKSSIHPS